LTSIGYLNLKESILKNKNLKKIHFDQNHDFTNTDILNDEFHLIYKLTKLTKNDFNFGSSKNIYFSSPNIHLKLNYLICFIDEIHCFFLNFHHFDFKILFI
jgi:hypothetical protein